MIMPLWDYSYDLLPRIVEAVDTSNIFDMSNCSRDLDDQSFKISKMDHAKKGVPKRPHQND